MTRYLCDCDCDFLTQGKESINLSLFLCFVFMFSLSLSLFLPFLGTFFRGWVYGIPKWNNVSIWGNVDVGRFLPPGSRNRPPGWLLVVVVVIIIVVVVVVVVVVVFRAQKKRVLAKFLRSSSVHLSNSLGGGEVKQGRFVILRASPLYFTAFGP